MKAEDKSPGLLVAGGGPAGLMAAQTAAELGCEVTVIDAKPSVGRKFLVAGKSGLNLTNAEAMPGFVRRYSSHPERWGELLGDFDGEAMRRWAADLGYGTFVSSGGKVFPDCFKAGPILRAWIDALKASGVRFRTGEEVVEISLGAQNHLGLTLRSGETLRGRAAILAFGGASWSSTGSTGKWIGMLRDHGVAVSPLVPANCGWETDWPEAIRKAGAGLPLKNIVVRVGDASAAGELVITANGLEGGPIYQLGPHLRRMDSPRITIDLKPSRSREEIEEILLPVRKNFVREARRRLRLGEAAGLLLKHLLGLGPWKSGRQIAAVVKKCPIPLTGPRPIDEAISSAGGVCWSELNRDLMNERLPGVFVAGEMIDWEAPTGGYLLHGCFATGRRAALGAIKTFAHSLPR